MICASLKSPIQHRCALFVTLLSASCCSVDERRLDPQYRGTLLPHLMLRNEPALNLASKLDQIAAGDVIAYTTRESSSDGSLMLGSALGEYTHIAIVYSVRASLRVLSADSRLGVFSDSLEAATADREFSVYRFPPRVLDLERLRFFARTAVQRGTLDYDWSAVLVGANDGMTPNTAGEIGGEYTCATVVAAALHYSGLSLDRAHCSQQYVSPGDVIYSKARRNENFVSASNRE